MTISPSYPDLLQNGNPADATQVMANFYKIQNDVNANAAENGANSSITSLTGLTTPLSIAQGGTGQTTANGILLAIGGAASGANSDITSLAGLATPLSIAQGGTSAATGPAALTALGGLSSTLAASTYAPLTSPALVGVPTAPTATPGTNTTQIATTAFFLAAFATKSLTFPGYQQLPGGLIIQWGACPLSTGASVTFPITYPTACLTVVACSDSNGNGFSRVGAFQQAGFSWDPGNGPSAGFYIAIGY